MARSEDTCGRHGQSRCGECALQHGADYHGDGTLVEEPVVLEPVTISITLIDSPEVELQYMAALIALRAAFHHNLDQEEFKRCNEWYYDRYKE